MYYKKTKFLVAGLQKSGLSATKTLLEKGADVYVYDKRTSEQVVKNIEALEFLGAKKVTDYKSAVEYIDVLVISPGVPIDSPICKIFKQANKRIIGELELGALQFNTPIIAVTGTNGKTTVSTLLHKALTKSGYKSVLAGNVGVPVCSVVDEINQSEFAVIEVSSFQLETTYAFTPHVSIVLNITPDHLDRHYSMENYTLVKSKIVLPLRESEFAILNHDDETVKRFNTLTRAKILWFSTKEKVDGGYILDGAVYFFEEKVLDIENLKISQPHNLENILAVVCALKIVGVENSQIEKALTEFKGIKHRLESIKTVNGVEFVNDSKSTNSSSAIKAVESLNKSTVIILGGSDKGLDYTELFEKIKSCDKIKRTVITGENANSMLAYAVKVNLDGVVVVKGFENAVKTAYALCENQGVVLLSPATASFDEFSDFEKRGERFAEIVNSIS